MSTIPATAAMAAPAGARVRDRVARMLLIVVAIGAVGAAIGAAGVVADAESTTRMVETWRMLGYVVFAGMFLLLAYRPRVYAGIWELAILNKLGLSIAALVYGADIVGARASLAADGAITLLLIAAYVLSRGWQAWSTVRESK